MVAGGDRIEFLKKTRWGDDDRGPCRDSQTRKTVSIEEVEKYAGSILHTLHSAPYFTRDREHTLKCNGLSVFSGCGGLAMGFYEAGVRVVGHVEIDDAARMVLEKNFPSSLELGRDIKRIDQNKLNDFKVWLPPIDIVFGGPPCQGFSLTGKRDVYDPRNQLYQDYARFVGVLRPKSFILENVRTITSMKTPSDILLIDDLLQTFRSLGYKVGFSELNASDHGVPQSRGRLFIIGIDGGVFTNNVVTFPAPTHSKKKHSPLPRLVTLRDAIGDLEYLESGEKSEIDPLHFAASHASHVIRMLKDVKEGGSAHDNPDPGVRPMSGYNTTYKRLRWDEPASTISTTFGVISGSKNVHPMATRSLTVREAMRCQTFPDDFIIFGKLGEVRTMIGNAVPPRLAYAIANHVIELCLAKL